MGGKGVRERTATVTVMRNELELALAAQFMALDGLSPASARDQAQELVRDMQRRARAQEAADE